ncbi:hypothetical protein N9061_03045 [bacterium]|nr:hypothetical protein [bacterium]
MTVLDNTPRDQYTATGGQVAFSYTFEIAAEGDIAVLQNGVLLSLGTGAGEYAVTGVGSDTGGVVTLVTGATAGDIITLYRDMALERLTSYTNGGDFLAADVNNDYDRLWLALQQNTGTSNRALVAPNTDPTDINMTIPTKTDRLGKLLQFNATTGNPEVVSANSIVGSGAFNVYNFTGDGATVAFTLGTSPGVENNTQVYIDGVYQQKNTYTVSGTTLTFSAAPPNLSTIEVMVVTAQPINTANAASVSFTQAGSTDTRTVQAKLEESVSVTDFGAVGDGVTDDTAAIQGAITTLAINGGTLLFPSKTFLISSQIILPFGNNATNKLFTIDFGNCVITSGISTPTGASFTGLISGYLSGTTPVASITGTEAHVAANVVMRNLNLRGFGTGIRLHNFNYGCAIRNFLVEDCYNGIDLSRCFYILLDNISSRGTGRNEGGVAFKTGSFSNVMPIIGLKVSEATTGMELGGFDGGKLISSSAEVCQIGINLVTECTAIHLDTVYLENNTVTNLKFSAVVRRLIVSNSWFYGAATQHITSAMAASAYSQVTLLSNFFQNGITNSPPINNIYGEIINCNSDPLTTTSFSGLPKVVLSTPAYEVDSSASGYNGPIRSLDTQNTIGIIPTAYGGRFRDGIISSTPAPYQTTVDNAGSFEFTTQFFTEPFTSLLWSVSINHSAGNWSRNYTVFYDAESAVWRLYKPDAAGLTLDATVSCADNGGFLRLKAPTFTSPVVNFSYVRTI